MNAVKNITYNICCASATQFILVGNVLHDVCTGGLWVYEPINAGPVSSLRFIPQHHHLLNIQLHTLHWDIAI